MTLGICCSELAVISDASRVLADIAAFGFNRVRFEVPWAAVESVKGQRNWAAVTNVVKLASKYGIELLPILGVHTPTWSWTAADYGSFCADAAKVIRSPRYEIWNEPNLHQFLAMGSASTYVPWLKSAYAAIKAVQPSALIVLGGLAAAESASGFNWFFWVAPFGWWANTSPERFLQNALQAGARGYFDVCGYHPYSIDAAFVPQPPNAKQVMISRIDTLKQMSPAPVLLTEWGFDLSRVDAVTAASWFTAQIQIPSMAGESFFYSWRDYGTNRCGLVDANNTPRQPLYNAVKAVVGQP